MEVDIQFEILNYEWYALAENIEMQRCYSIDLDYKGRWQYNKTSCNVFLQGAKTNQHLLCR